MSVFTNLTHPAGAPAVEGTSLTPLHRSLARFGGQGYAGNRVGGAVSNSNETWVLGGSSNNGSAWEQLGAGGGPAPEPRNRHCAVSFGDLLVVLFGRVTPPSAAAGATRDAPVAPWALNVTSREWAALPAAGAPPLARSGAACFGRGRSVVFAGGVTAGGTLLDDVGAYHLPSGSWRSVAAAGAAPPPGYGGASAFAAANDVAVLHGGRLSSPLASSSLTSGVLHALVFDGTNDTLPDGGFAGIRGAWVRPAGSGPSPLRAFHAGAWLPSSQRFCALGGVEPQSWGDAVLNDVLCTSLGAWLAAAAPAARVAGSGGAGGRRRLQASPAPPPAVSWRLLSLPAGQPAPPPRAFGAVCAVPPGAAGALAWNESGGGDPPLVLTGGRDYEVVFGDAWRAQLPPADAAPFWVNPPTPEPATVAFLVSYLAYGVALFVLTSICFIMLLRQARTATMQREAYRRAHQSSQMAALEAALAALVRNEAAFEDGRRTDAIIVASLPTTTYHQPASRGAPTPPPPPPPPPAGSTLAVRATGGGGGQLAVHAAPGASAFDPNQQDECAICLSAFKDGDELRVLPCLHLFHKVEIDEWLLRCSTLCPLCKASVVAAAI